MSQMVRVLGFILLGLLLTNCERKVATESHVAIQLPSSSKASSLTTCSMCLKAIVLKVEGDNFSKILTSQVHQDVTQADSELTGVISIDVPTGSARKFSIMAIYRLSDKTYKVLDGFKTVDLADQNPLPVEIPLSTIAELRGGGIVGRYLTGTDTGPTGQVLAKLHHPSDDDLTLTILQNEIIDGWFNFYASENFPMTFQMTDMTAPLFSKVTINSLVPLAGGVAITNIARIHRPSDYYRFNSNNWEFEHEYHDIVYGFFGAAALTSNKYVCFENVSTTLSRLSPNSGGSPPMYYDSVSMSADVYPVFGLNSSNTPCLGSTTSPRYTQNQIAVNSDQLNGNGNDMAAGMVGIFTSVYLPTSQTIAKSNTISGGLIQLKTMPGLLGVSGTAKFSGIKLFRKPNATNGGFDDLHCSADWMSTNGFNELALADYSMTPTISTDSALFSLNPSTANMNDGYVVCPTNTDNLQGMGGMYVGKMDFEYLTHSSVAAFSGPMSQAITITNSGTTNIMFSTATVSSTNTTFGFLGGTSPGIGGTCVSMLMPGNSCTYVIDYTGGMSDVGHLTVPYNATALVIPLTGTP